MLYTNMEKKFVFIYSVQYVLFDTFELEKDVRYLSGS